MLVPARIISLSLQMGSMCFLEGRARARASVFANDVRGLDVMLEGFGVEGGALLRRRRLRARLRRRLPGDARIRQPSTSLVSCSTLGPWEGGVGPVGGPGEDRSAEARGFRCVNPLVVRHTRLIWLRL